MASKIRLYFSEKIQSDLISHLDNNQSHYLKDVMRLKEGSELSIFNEHGEWNAILKKYNKGKAEIKILEKTKNTHDEKNIWLAFCPIKQNPLNFVFQKGTELGVKKFIPILSERTITKEINNERVRKIVVEASEQSNRISIPEIDKIDTLKNFLKKFPNNGYLLFCDINSNAKNFQEILSKKIEGPICALVGPEGDFSESEKKAIVNLKQTHSISIAKNILKAETAALSVVALINHCLNL